MNDIVFYWSAWAPWIWAAWIMDKGKIRTRTVFFSLIAIICSNHTFSIAGYTVNMTVLFFLFLSVFFILKKPFSKQIYLMIIGGETALGYASILLLSSFDPVLFILPVNVLTTIFLLCISYIVTNQPADKLFLVFFSTTVGEIIVGIIFGNLHLHYEIGMNGYLTRISLPFLIIAILSTLKTMVMKNKFV